MSTIIRNQKLFCTCCGGEYTIIYPIGVSEISKKINSFDELHKDYPQTWVEPTPGGRTQTEKAMWWAANGEHGMSSDTMFAVFTGQNVN